MHRRILLTAIAACAATATLSAHDFWLAASPWTPAAGATVTITANVGETFPKGDTFTAAERVAEWRVMGPSGDMAVKEFRRDGDSLATDVLPPSPGVYLGIMTIAPRTIEMKGDEFTKYLQEEGLTSVIAARQAAGEADKATKEQDARYAKVAIRRGGGGAWHLMRAADLPAEFVPVNDPTMVSPGASLSLQLLAGGKPVAGAAVHAVSGSGGTPLNALTDSDGRVTFKIDQAGAWLVKTIHMVRLPPGSDAEWESFWVTLAFQVAGH